MYCFDEMFVRRIGAVMLGLGAVATVILRGQGQAPVQTPPVFRAGVDYVAVDVVVTDRSDKPVANLTREDFVISEAGRPQTIVDFKFVSVPVSRTVIDPARTKLTIDIATNHSPPQSRAFVVVIDDLHLLPRHLPATKGVLTEVLTSIPPTDRVAVVFTGRSDLSVDFTNDPKRLMAVVDRLKGALGFAQDPRPVWYGPDEQMRRHFALGALDVLDNVATALAQSRAERRAVILISEGFNYDFTAMPKGSGDVQALIDAEVATPRSVSSMPGDPPENVGDAQEVLRRLKRVYEAARRADVPIYSIDPRGNASPDTAAAGFMPVDAERMQIQSKMQLQNGFLRNVAAETGGLAQVSRSDLAGGVREMIEDTGSYYLLGYYPNPSPSDGQYHSFDVKVSRPGLRVRGRTGYLASSANAKVSSTGLLDQALQAALPVEGLQLRAFIAPVQPTASGAMKSIVTLEVSYPPPVDGVSRIDDEMQFGVLALDAEGKSKASARRAFRFAMTPRGPADIPYVINDVIDLPAGEFVLRVGVASQTLGKAGTIHVPVEVIDTSSAQLQLGALVMGFAGPPREAAMRAEALQSLVSFQPTTARTFATADTLQLFMPLFWRSNSSLAEFTLTMRGDRATLSRSETATTAPARGDRHSATMNTTLPLNDLSPGRYTLEVVARLSNGQTATRAVAIDVR